MLLLPFPMRWRQRAVARRSPIGSPHFSQTTPVKPPGALPAKRTEVSVAQSNRSQVSPIGNPQVVPVLFEPPEFHPCKS